MQNPFSISFGRINEKVIRRDHEIQPIFQDFDSEPTRNTVYIITGPRGCGKTVTLGYILDEYYKKDNWVVARLTQSDNMLEQMASLLYENGLVKLKSFKVEFSFSFYGITFSVKGEKPVSSIHAYLKKLLEYYKKKNIHILVAIDDVAKNDGMVEFIRAYQGFLIDHYDVRLLMTGLEKNISKLESDRSLTFLFRAPRIQLTSLSLAAIYESYKSTFDVSEDDAIKLAKATKGYALAYQVLGDILFRTGERTLSKKVLSEFDVKLNDWSYRIIWSELSNEEKRCLFCISSGASSNRDLMEKLNISKGALSIYKNKLSKEGLIDTSIRGKVSFSLPRFGEFITLTKKLED